MPRGSCPTRRPRRIATFACSWASRRLATSGECSWPSSTTSARERNGQSDPAWAIPPSRRAPGAAACCLSGGLPLAASRQVNRAARHLDKAILHRAEAAYDAEEALPRASAANAAQSAKAGAKGGKGNAPHYSAGGSSHSKGDKSGKGAKRAHTWSERDNSWGGHHWDKRTKWSYQDEHATPLKPTTPPRAATRGKP